MEISSLNHRVLAIHATGDDPLSPAVAVDLPLLRKLQAKNDAASRRKASLPVAHLEELCSDLDVVIDNTNAGKKSMVSDRRLARMVSDIGEVIGREKGWATGHKLAAPTPRLHRLASHRLPRAPSYSAQRGVRSEIIAEEDEKSCKSNVALEADIQQIKITIQSLQTELMKQRETTVAVKDAHSQILTEIDAKLDGVTPWQQRNFERPSPELLKKKATREGGGGSSSSSSSKEQSYRPQAEQLLMN